MKENARPKLTSSISNMDEYTTIYLGYPIWNTDLLMPLYTFLEEYDLSGKTIIPFNTHGGSGFANTIQTISDLQKDARIDTDGLSISRNTVEDSEAEIVEWLKNKN